MPPQPLPLVIVAAVARNGALGDDGRLPARLPGDLRRYKALTMGKPMIMGRKTWDSIGRALPGRETIVISRAAGFRPEGAHVVHDFDAALSLGQQLGRAMSAASVIVAGGGEIYAGLIGRADRIELTEVDVEFAGRTRFPLINPDEWQETAREEGVRGPKDEAAFRFVTYERRARSAPPVEKRGDGT